MYPTFPPARHIHATVHIVYPSMRRECTSSSFRKGFQFNSENNMVIPNNDAVLSWFLTPERNLIRISARWYAHLSLVHHVPTSSRWRGIARERSSLLLQKNFWRTLAQVGICSLRNNKTYRCYSKEVVEAKIQYLETFLMSQLLKMRFHEQLVLVNYRQVQQPWIATAIRNQIQLFQARDSRS